MLKEDFDIFINEVNSEEFRALNEPRSGKKIQDVKNEINNKSVIVVGNSSLMLDCKYGELIDSHDCVIRCNLGFNTPDRHVYLGEKTDIWVTSWSSKNKYSNDKFMRGLSFFKNCNMFLFLFAFNNMYVKNKFFLNKCYQDSVDNYCELSSRLIEKPSTGCMVINFLYNNIDFKSLSIVGFDFNRSKTSLSGWKKGYECCHNSNGREEEYIMSIVKSGKASFYEL